MSKSMIPARIENSIRIPVVFASDENYLMPTYVAIYSMFINSKTDSMYDIYILVPESVDDFHKKDIIELMDIFPEQRINFVNMGSSFANVIMSIEHITMPTYYRLHIPDILHNYEKCIYLDSDLIVNADLTDFFNTDVSGYYIAGVKAAAYHLVKNGNEGLRSILKIPSIDTYVNAGVLLLNLKKMRRDNLADEMLNLVDKGYPSQDQDIINKTCFGKIKILPVKYNVMTKYSIFGGRGRSDAREYEVYPFKDVMEAKRYPAIIHYADKIKPWQSKNVIHGDRWWNIAERLPDNFKKKNIDTLQVTDEFQEKTISIFGSTKSSQIIPNHAVVVNEFVAGISVMSANEDPITLEIPDDFMKGFDRQSVKTVLHDINKTAIPSLLSIVSDYVMIDNHECRFNLIDVDFYGEKVRLTDSYLIRRVIESDSNIKVINRIKIADLTDEECEKAVKNFANQILKVYDIKQIIINEVIETETYLTERGKIGALSNSSEIRTHNLNSRRIYNLYRKYFKGAHFVSMPRGIISSTYSPASDNFNHDYYEQKHEAVKAIMNGKKESYYEDGAWYRTSSEKNEKISEFLRNQEIDDPSVQISIIVPTYNNEDTLEECITSILNQSITPIEVICVNDCSTDRTLLILERLKKADRRLRIINNEGNIGASVSRKNGVNSAIGNFTMFVDADDYLEPNACEKMLRTILSRNVDIVCCGANVINIDQPKHRVNWMTNFVKPRLGYMRHSDIFKETFLDKKSNHLLWNKIIKTSVCKDAYANVSDLNYPKGNDRYAYFFMALKAKSYYGIEDKLYNYRLGAGISNKKDMSIDRFKEYLKEYNICDELEKHLIQNEYDRQYLASIEIIREEITNNLSKIWYEHLSDAYSSESFNELVKRADIAEVAGGLAKISCKDLNTNLAKRFLKILDSGNKVKSIKTVGIFYYRLSNGGVERVISKLIPGYLELGYSVVLILEERNKDEEFPIPNEVEVRVINKSKNISKDAYVEHARDLHNVIIEQDIDILLYQASTSPFLLYDAMIAKSLGILFSISLHTTFSQQMVLRQTDFIELLDVFGVADYIHTLNRMEENLWKSFGYNSKYIRNPLTFDLEDTTASDLTGDNIIWVGRFDDHQKCFTEAIDVFKIIHTARPNTKMYMVGKGESASTDLRVEEYIRSKNLSNSIILTGYVDNVSKYYTDSSIFLCTSAYETYPMALGEAMSHGLPIVMFDLPYLEILKDSRGYISVNQKDVEGLASAVLRIIDDPDVLKNMSVYNLKSIEEITNEPLFEEWSQLFSELINHSEKPKVDNKFSMFIRTLLFHYKLGIKDTKIVSQGSVTSTNDSESIKHNASDTISAGIRYFRRNGIKNSLMSLYNNIKKGLFSK